MLPSTPNAILQKRKVRECIRPRVYSAKLECIRPKKECIWQKKCIRPRIRMYTASHPTNPDFGHFGAYLEGLGGTLS